jgi:Gram-negative bacterial TonB protein C-terminal
MTITFVGFGRLSDLLFFLLIAASITACSTNGPPTGAAGRPVQGDTVINPGPIKSCDKSSFDSPPKFRSATRPKYPLGRLLEDKEDIVDVVFLVDRQGRATLISAKSQKDKDRDSIWFRNHAEFAMSKWQLDPATKDKQPVETICVLQFVFRLE